MSYGQSSGGESSSSVQAYRPDFYQTPYQWNLMPQEMLGQLGNDIQKGVGSNFGQRNLYGSGMMKDVFAEKLAQAAVGGSRFAPVGQWMNPSLGQTSETTPVSSQEFGLK